MVFKWFGLAHQDKINRKWIIKSHTFIPFGANMTELEGKSDISLKRLVEMLFQQIAASDETTLVLFNGKFSVHFGLSNYGLTTVLKNYLVLIRPPFSLYLIN